MAEYRVTITLTDEQGAALHRFLGYRRLCGSLDPEGNPLDALGLQVLRAAQAQHRERSEDGLSGLQ